jgi:RecG-like helicase
LKTILNRLQTSENRNDGFAKRLIIEELCAQQLSLLQLKKQRKNKTTNIFKIKDNLKDLNNWKNFVGAVMPKSQLVP